MANFTYEDAVTENERHPTITATDENDHIDTTLSDAFHRIYANAGDDVILSIGGSIYGGDGNDKINILFPQSGKYEYIPNAYGGNGNDVIIVSTSFLGVSLYGESGNDILKGSNAKDTLRGGDGDDTLHGNGGNDEIYGDSGNNVLYGDDGNDSIWSTEGDDYINGGSGDDYILAGNGNDIIEAGQGRNTISAGAGYDTAIFNISTSEVVSYDNLNGVVTLQSHLSSDTIYHVEQFQFLDKTISIDDMDQYFSHVPLIRGENINVYRGDSETFGTSGNDVFNVSSYADVKIDAGSGNDVINLGYGRDFSKVDGGDGVDTVSLDTPLRAIGGFLEKDGEFLLITAGANDSFKNIETIRFNDGSYTLDEFKTVFSNYKLSPSTILGTSNTDNLNGTANDDTFYSSSGYDKIDGKEGEDTAIVRLRSTDIYEYTNNNNEVIIAGGFRGVSYKYTLTNIEKIDFLDITLNHTEWGDAFIKVNTSDQTIMGSAGDDSLFNGRGNDYIDGLGGIDTAFIDANTHEVKSYSNSNGSFTFITTKYGKDTFSNIEFFHFNDLLIDRNDLDAVFSLVDTKPKTFFATNNDDDFIGGLGDDVAVLNFATSDVEIFSLTDYWDERIYDTINKVILTSQKGTDSFSNIDIYQFTDKTLTIEELEQILSGVRLESDVIFGTFEDDVINAGFGSDRIYAWGGNDIVKGNSGNDDIEGDAGNDTIYGGMGNDYIDGGGGDDLIYGGEGDDTIYGDDYHSITYDNYRFDEHGKDTIYAGLGNDTIYGGGNLNIVDGGEGEDTVVLPFSTVQVSLYGVINGEVQFDGAGIASYKIKNVEQYQFTDKTLTNSDNLDSIFSHVSYNDQTFTGTDGDDLGLGGGEGNDIIIPKLGNDIIFGRSGFDKIIFSISTTDVTSYTESGPNVTLVSSEGKDEIFLVESFQFTDQTISFDELASFFAQVNTQSQTLFGTNGDDELTGGLGDDIINSSDGNDAIDGGADGKDILAFHITKDEVSTYSNDSGVITLTYSGSVDTISNIDFFQFTDVSVDFASLDATFAQINTADQNIIGDDADNELSGGLGNDTFTPKAGDDKVDGVSGNDTASINVDASKVTGYSNDGVNVVITSTEGVDTFSNINVFKFNDITLNYADLDQAFASVTVTSKTIIGDESDNKLTGALAKDTITPGEGNDEVDGAAGIDTVVFNIASSDVKALSVSGDKIIITSTEGIDAFTNVELFKFSDKEVAVEDLPAVFASVITDDQFIEGDDSANTLKGALGDDTISPKGGDDTVDGAAGTDTVVLGIAKADVTGYSESGGVVTVTSTAGGTDTISNVESFQFTDDTVAAGSLATEFAAVNTANQTITGTSGADTLTGALGDDTITPDTGDDTVDGAEGEDTAILNIESTAITAYSINGDTVTISSPDGNDHFERVEHFKFADTTIKLQDLDSVLSAVLIKDQTFTSTTANDAFMGGDGNDTAIFGYETTDLNSVTKDGEFYKIAGAEGVDTLSKIEVLQFTDKTLPITDLLLGTQQSETITGTSEDDIIDAGKGLDSIHAGNGDDLILNVEIGEHIDGGLGLDLIKFNFASTEVSSIMRKLDGSIELSTASGNSTLEDLNKIAFTDTNAIDIDNYIASQNPLKPSFNAIVKGKSIAATPEEYTGGVDFLEFQLLGDAEGNIVTGSAFNDFLNLLDGDDAANGGAGRDVLDGGTGSNFLTGGADADTFFLDGRGGTVTWSTITDFDGDSVNIWGWQEGVSKLIQSVESAGAEGFKGATFHFDLNNDGDIDTSITFSGLALGDVPESSPEIIANNGYLLFSH